MESKKYFYLEGTEKRGPFSLNEIISLINLETYVWTKGMNEWSKAKIVSEIFELIANEEPPEFFPEIPNVVDEIFTITDKDNNNAKTEKITNVKIITDLFSSIFSKKNTGLLLGILNLLLFFIAIILFFNLNGFEGLLFVLIFTIFGLISSIIGLLKAVKRKKGRFLNIMGLIISISGICFFSWVCFLRYQSEKYIKEASSIYDYDEPLTKEKTERQLELYYKAESYNNDFPFNIRNEYWLSLQIQDDQKKIARFEEYNNRIVDNPEYILEGRRAQRCWKITKISNNGIYTIVNMLINKCEDCNYFYNNSKYSYVIKDRKENKYKLIKIEGNIPFYPNELPDQEIEVILFFEPLKSFTEIFDLVSSKRTFTGDCNFYDINFEKRIPCTSK